MIGAIVLMTSKPHKRLSNRVEAKPLEDTGTCLNCIYQGTGAEQCKKCNRSMAWKFYKKPSDVKDNFKIKIK